MSKKVAIITGASSGLGQEFVRQLDGFTQGRFAGIKRPDELWVLARREERLRELQALTDIPVRPLPCDLTDMASALALEALLQTEHPEVVLLINAAGYGKIGLTENLSLDDVTGMVDLNCRAAVAVTQVCLPYMEKGDRIVQICSTSAFQPFTRLGVYAASKAFLLSYSRSLDAELRPRGITVTAVCPYWVKDTEFIATAEQGSHTDSPFEDETAATNRWSEILNPSGNEDIRSYPLADTRESVVHLALLDTSIGLNVSTPGLVCMFHRFLRHLIPTDLMILAWEGLRRIG